MGVHPPVVLASRSCPPRRRGPIPFRYSPSRVLAKAGTHPTPLFRLPPCPREGGDPSHSVIPPPLSFRAEPRNLVAGFSPSSSAIFPLPQLPLPCYHPPMEILPSPSSPPVSSRRRGPIPLRHSPSRVLAKAGTHPLRHSPSRVLAKAGTHPPPVIPPPVSSRRRGPIPSVIPPPLSFRAEPRTHPTPSFPLPCPREGGDPSHSVIPPPTCHSEQRRGISLPGLASPLLPSVHCRNSPSPVSIPPWKYSLPLPSPSVSSRRACPREGKAGTHPTPSSLLPCPREGGDPSPSVIPPITTHFPYFYKKTNTNLQISQFQAQNHQKLPLFDY